MTASNKTLVLVPHFFFLHNQVDALVSGLTGGMGNCGGVSSGDGVAAAIQQSAFGGSGLSVGQKARKSHHRLSPLKSVGREPLTSRRTHN